MVDVLHEVVDIKIITGPAILNWAKRTSSNIIAPKIMDSYIKSIKLKTVIREEIDHDISLLTETKISPYTYSIASRRKR